MSWHIREAVRHIVAGGVIAYPTETVYGLGCNPFNAAAVLHLLTLKQRSPDNGVILIGTDLQQFQPFLQPLSKATTSRVKRTGRKPVTWVLPCTSNTPAWLIGTHDSLAIRISQHPVVTALCTRWGGPLVSTSANIHGQRPATSALSVRLAFDGQLDYILHGPNNATNIPSSIRDGLSGVILRP